MFNLFNLFDLFDLFDLGNRGNRQIEHRIGPLEAVGFRPLLPALRQSVKAIAGDHLTKASRWGVSSLSMFNPSLGIRTWLGLRPAHGKVPVFNLFNRRCAPRDEGYDVRTTDVLDYRGGRVTYNSHQGVDFAVPIGTTVVAPAPGLVVVVENLIYRGGLKVVIDHGDGLISVCAHLARARVQRGQQVLRGQAIGLSGYSAIDGVLAFPWIPPHVHFTVLHDGEPADPFAQAHETALWLDGNEPRPCPAAYEEPRREPTPWNRKAVDEAIASLRDEPRRALLSSIDDLQERAAHLAYWRFYNYTAFDAHPPLTARSLPRRPRLSLPFQADEGDGIEVIER